MTAGEFRNGVTFEMDGQVQQVIEFQMCIRDSFMTCAGRSGQGSAGR